MRLPLKAMRAAASTAGAAASGGHLVNDRARQPQSVGCDLTHRYLPRIGFAPLATHGNDHQQRESAHPRERERVDAVADAAALHQQDTALAAEPGAGQNSDAFLFGGEYGRLHLIGGVAQLDQPRMPRVRDVNDVANVEFAQLVEDQARPVRRIGRDHTAAVFVRAAASPSLRGHLPSFQTDNRCRMASSAITSAGVPCFMIRPFSIT